MPDPLKSSLVPAKLVGRPGRPPALDQTIMDKIAEDIRDGARPRTAALANGVSEEQHRSWMNKALEPGANPLYAEYRAVIEGTHELAKLAVAKRMFEDALQGNPVNWLKHVGAEGFENGATIRHEHSGPKGRAIKHQHELPDTRDALLLKIKERFDAIALRVEAAQHLLPKSGADDAD